MRGVRADAHIGRHGELGHGFLHRTDRSRHDVVGLAREHRVFVLAIGDPEDEKPGETRRRGDARLAHDLGERQPLEPRRDIDLFAVLDRTRDDDREDRPVGELGRAERARPHRMLGEPPAGQSGLAHGGMVRM